MLTALDNKMLRVFGYLLASLLIREFIMVFSVTFSLYRFFTLLELLVGRASDRCSEKLNFTVYAAMIRAIAELVNV